MVGFSLKGAIGGSYSIVKIDSCLGICCSNCMPKKSRIDTPGALHHISVQTIGKSVIRGEKLAKAKKYLLTGK